MTTLQRAIIILAAFCVISILLPQVDSHSSSRLSTAQLAPKKESAVQALPSATVNINNASNDENLIERLLNINSAQTTNEPKPLANIVTNIYQTSSGSFYFEQQPSVDSTNLHQQETQLSTQALQYQSANLQSTHADISITGPIARTKLTQVFANTSNHGRSGIYVFPLPQDAAVDSLIMQVGKRKIEAKIMRKALAKELFTKAKVQGKSASMLAQIRPNIFTNKIANIPANSSISVTIEYQQFIVQDKHNYGLRLPLSITPRYVPSHTSDKQSNEAQQQANTLATNNTILPANTSIRVRLNTGLPLSQISSEHHPIKTLNPYSTYYEIELDTQTPANKDFVLNWQLRPGYNVQASHFRYASDEYEYGLISIVPPTNDLLNARRNVTFVLDVSGSMVGEALSQAKQALALAIEDLNEDDYFNFIAFSSDAKRLFTEQQAATEGAKEDALSYLYTLEANGGTEIKKALDSAFALPTKGDINRAYLNQIIFITDGSVSNENELLQSIYAQLGQYRLFTVGIGSAPNAYFMKRAAEAGKGTFTFIGDIDLVKPKVHALLEKLKRPALTDIVLNVEDVKQAFNIEVYPSIIPDLYADETLTISYRRALLSADSKTELPFTIKGQFLSPTMDGKFKSRQWSSQLPGANAEQKQGLHKHWARLKIKDLQQQINMKGHYNDDNHRFEESIKEAITKLGLEHNLVSPYTSLIAIDHSESQFTRNAALKGQQQNQYAQARLPQTATPSLLLGLLGSVLVVFSSLLYFFTGARL